MTVLLFMKTHNGLGSIIWKTVHRHHLSGLREASHDHTSKTNLRNKHKFTLKSNALCLIALALPGEQTLRSPGFPGALSLQII